MRVNVVMLLRLFSGPWQVVAVLLLYGCVFTLTAFALRAEDQRRIAGWRLLGRAFIEAVGDEP